MLSRVADALFWMSRYVERAENVARFIDVNFHMILDGSTGQGEDWKTADGEPAIRDGQTARYLPEKAWDDLTPAQKKATEAKKRTGSRTGKQTIPNTEAAKKARKKATS